MFGRSTLVIAALSLFAVGALPADASHPANPLQPGDVVTGPIGQCTLNFVFDGTGSQAGKVFMGIAAHCIEPGNSMSSTGYTAFGTAVYDDDTFTDFGLIEVKSTVAPHVSAQVRGHPVGTPAGFTTPTDTALGDTVKYSGYGLGYSLTTQTQTMRVGVLHSDNVNVYCSEGPAIFGDSGGPVVHAATGKALGIVSSLGFGSAGLVPCSPQGPTVQAALARASIDGFPIALRTA